MVRFGWVAVVLAAGLMGGCQQEQPATEQAAPEPVATGEGLIPNTPAGDLEQWLADMKSALAELTKEIDTNRAEAHKRVLDLYVSRQEYAEMYYGPSGRMGPEPALAEAVKANENRFHDLMRLTGSVPAASSDSIKVAVKALADQITVVESNAQKSARRVRGAAQ